MTDAGSKSSVKASEPEEIEDPVESMLKKTGCTELHYKVQVSNWIFGYCFNLFFEMFKICGFFSSFFAGVYC